MRSITSRHNPLVRTFKAAARGRGERDSILLDGLHLIEEARIAGVRLTTVVFSSWLLDRDSAATALANDLDGEGADVHVVPDTLLEAISPVSTPSGAVALADRPAASVTELPADALVPVVVDVQDPGNVGAIVRTAEAAGATAFVAAGATADPFGWKALRASMGSAFRLRVARNEDVAATLDTLRASGVRMVAAVPRNGTSLFEAELRPPIALLIGSEGSGLPEPVVRSADIRLTIPMHPPVESLNASIAAAIVLFEIARQRAAHGVAAR